MSTQEIRLRLSVRRHGIPEVKLVWPCKRSADVTIAKLLASVNEVVPLESSEWGLEDYAVELVSADGDSYECLHFQLVAQTLKDEDQLIVRPLLTDDVRRRRISGRHQISIDGKHLVDGVAFGRPWLRAPRDRPALELPPRKRARIEAHELEVGEPGPEQLFMLEAPPERDDDDDDDDWDPKKKRDAAHDSSEPEEDGGSTSDYSGSDEEHFECSRKELDEEIMALLDSETDTEEKHSHTDKCSVEHLAAIGKAYPLLSFATIEKELLKQNQNLRKTYDALQKSTSPSLSFDDMMDRMVMGTLDQSESSPMQEQSVNILRGPSPPQRPLIEELASDESADSCSSSSGITSSDDESGSNSSSDDDEDEDDYDSEEESSFDENRVPQRPLVEELASNEKLNSAISCSSSSGITSSDDESGSNSSSEDDDDYDSEEESSIDGDHVSSSEGTSEDSSDVSSDDGSSDTSDGLESEPVKVPDSTRVERVNAPSMGLNRTQKRNARRRKQKARQKALKQQIASTPGSGHAELLARKEALLGILLADDVDADDQQSPAKVEASVSTSKDDQLAEASTSTKTSETRRTRVDMGAGRRMLFGALGLKNPKSKSDEEYIKQKLMKGVKPLNNSRIVEVNDGNATQIAEEDTDPNAWKSKITYRAVECCHEGMKLSEPPFPFVQRWDPQQQYGSMRKKKRKAEEIDADYNGLSPCNGSKPTKGDPFKGEVNGAVESDSNVAETIINGINGHEEADEADLPEVPEDPSNLPALGKGAAKNGMVITWKQCTMSKATQWQPVVKSITGEVLSESNESSLEVRLAFRDREYTEKIYDEKTGQRIYDKFEAPDFDNEDDEEDDGLRTLAWEDMTEPKILAVTSPWAAQEGK